ncbi:MAG: thioredoxin family protein [Candidatus Bathyarchaeota archaeon]|nr:MAG: thioredoxin family protein [Candidatus Bathyarchaeota archaeon]
MSNVVDIQAEEWASEVMGEKGPVVVDFWHHMCGWCQRLNPVFAKLPEAFEDVKFLKVNILDSRENRRLAVENGVMGTPTIKVFCQGRAVGEVVGFKSYDSLVKDLHQILDQKDACLDQSTPLKK